MSWSVFLQTDHAIKVKIRQIYDIKDNEPIPSRLLLPASALVALKVWFIQYARPLIQVLCGIEDLISLRDNLDSFRDGFGNFLDGRFYDHLLSWSANLVRLKMLAQFCVVWSRVNNWIIMIGCCNNALCHFVGLLDRRSGMATVLVWHIHVLCDMHRLSKLDEENLAKI